MIAYLHGKIQAKSPKSIILSTGNIGYAVHLTKNLLATVQATDELSLFTHQQFREDASELYGFLTFEELTFFKQLISIKGIGPKVSMEILNLPQEKIINAVLNEDFAFISKIPGIGKKTAQRIVLEMKGELTKPINKETPEVQTDAEKALIKLGYNRHQIRQGLNQLPSEITVTEEIITYFLRNA
ncbi:MAG: Holliday junction branch migration protein RuvA [Candidatus Gracilibacteria bacterium]